MIKFIAKSIATKILRESEDGEFILKLSDEAFSWVDLYKNFNINVIKYAILYGLFWFILIVVLPATTFFLSTFMWSVLVFLVGLIFGITLTVRLVRSLPKMIYEEVRCRVDRLKKISKRNEN